MSVGGDASVGGGGCAAILEAHLERICITFCSDATGWASYSRVVASLRLGGAIDANDAMRAAGQGPVLQRARDGGQGGFRGLGRGNGLRGSRGIFDGKVRAVGGASAPCGSCLGSNANFPSCTLSSASRCRLVPPRGCRGL